MANRMNEKGFTLVEVLVALMIVGIAFVAIMTAFKQSYQVTWQSQERMIATNLAKTQLELLKTADNTGVAPTLPAVYKKMNNTYTVTTQNIAGSGIFATADMTPVRVTVSWTSHNKDFSVMLESCYIKNY